VVMTSAVEYSIIAEKAKDAGVDSFLQKPLFLMRRLAPTW